MNIIQFKSLPLQTGVSLIEMMVGLTLGIMVTLAMVYAFIISRQTMNATMALNQLQDNIRFGQKIITLTALQAGYRTAPLASAQEPFTTFTDVFPTGTEFASASNNDGINNSDSFTLRFQGSGDGAGTADGSLVDCARTAVDANAMATNLFSINSQQQLQCQAINTTGAGSDNTVVLLDDVENLQVLFGEDTDEDGYANRYVSPAYPNLDSTQIVSMKITLLLRSANEMAATTDTKIFNLLGFSWDPADDKRIRKLVSQTVKFRNKVPLE